MTEANLRALLAKNLAHYRRQSGLTQSELSERINYSDKSVSKWERGEGMPDVYVLTQLADIFGITINDLLADTPKPLPSNRSRQHVVIVLLSVGLVWLCATIAYFFSMLFAPNAPWNWMAFIVAIPVSAIVLVVFSCMWWKLWMRFLSVSLLLWGMALTIQLPLRVENISLIYVLAAVLQVLVVLWYVLMFIRKKPVLLHRRTKRTTSDAPDAVSPPAEEPASTEGEQA